MNTFHTLHLPYYNIVFHIVTNSLYFCLRRIELPNVDYQLCIQVKTSLNAVAAPDVVGPNMQDDNLLAETFVII